MAILSLVPSLAAQDIDAIITSENRKAATIADEIHDPAERAALLALFAKNSPEKGLALAEDFLQRYRPSAFLSMAYEIAARSSFGPGDLTSGLVWSGLDFAHQSLVLLLENPLSQAREHQNDSAISRARDALDYLDRFARPVAIPTATTGRPTIPR